MKNNTCEDLAQHLAQSDSGNIDTDFVFFNHMASFEDTATTSFLAPFLIHTHSSTVIGYSSRMPTRQRISL